MSITISLDGVDRTSNIEFGSLTKNDNINQKTDTMAFNILYYPGKTFRPTTDAEIIAMDGATKVFGGKVYKIDAAMQEMSVIKYKVSCKDYSYDLGRMLVTEEYDNLPLEDIITDLLATYAPTFTDVNTSCILNVKKVVFDHVTVLAAIEKLAQLSGYSWYVDYDKDIHFFPKNTEVSPFIIEDNNGNYIPDTLEVSDDFSQIRNRVFVKGGEIEGASRTETLSGTGAQLQFKLSNKFSQSITPTVSVGGVGKTVGIDFLDLETAFDCFWDFNNSYIRFKSTTIPAAAANNIFVTGLPLYTPIFMVEDPVSVANYGVFEFAVTDKTIKSREAGNALAKAQLQAYKDGLIEGGFETYTSGLRSGMVINVNSTLLGVNEDYLIQTVNYKQITPTIGYYKVTLATIRTVGLIDFLMGMLDAGNKIIEDTSNTILEKSLFPSESILVTDSVALNTNQHAMPEGITATEGNTVQALDYAVEFVAGPEVPTGTKRIFVLNGSRLG